jgi:hypothetical protein
VQKARPQSDLLNSGWTPPVGYSARIGTPIPDDTAPFVTSPVDPQGATFESQLGRLAWPHPGPQKLTVRLRETGIDDTTVNIALLQGPAIVARKSVTPSDAFSDFELSLPQDQISPITDYTDLRLRVTAGAVESPCCGTLPGTLTATIGSGTDGCACASGQSMLIVYDAGVGRWIGTETICGKPVTIQFWCTAAPDFVSVMISCPDGVSGPVTTNANACSPFYCNFPCGYPSPCCESPSGAPISLVVSE